MLRTSAPGQGGPRRRPRLVAATLAFALVVAGALTLPAVLPSPRADAAVASTVWDVPGAGYQRGDPVVALTFDDGPSATITPAILDVLARTGAVATFFEIGGLTLLHPELARRTVAQGSAVQSHTMDHVDLARLPLDRYPTEIDQDVALLQSLTGQAVTTVRPPFGSYNATVVAELARRGLTTVMWSCNPGDTLGYSSARMTEIAVACARPGAIIPFHDASTKAATLAALPGIIAGIRAKGLQLVTLAGASPIGNVELAADARGAIRVAGWALDPDAADPIAVHAYVDGTLAGGALADISRPDVGAAYPASGDRHGFDLVVPSVSGHRTVCVYGINIGRGSVNPLLGCRAVDLARVEPIGVIDGVEDARAALTVHGWAVDPDEPTSIAVHVYVDGRLAGGVLAADDRPDVAAALPGTGAAHGYTLTVPATTGRHHVCVYGINVGAGIVNPLLACRDATVAGTEPIGRLEAVTGGPGVLRVEGWTLDPDSTEPIAVHVYVDGVLVAAGTAGLARPDVLAAFPAAGAAHGFSIVVPAGAGVHVVRVYGINVGPGAWNPELGHATVLVG